MKASGAPQTRKEVTIMHSYTLTGVRGFQTLALVFPFAALAAGGGAQYPLVANPPWTQQQELTPSGGGEGQFGYSVSLSGTTAVIGSPGEAAAYVFVESGGVWSQQQELTFPGSGDYTEFGYSVSVSGDTAVVGAPYVYGPGSVYVFVRSNGVWTEQQALSAPGAVAGLAGIDGFGTSVSLSGNTVLIGAPEKTASLGAAYVFVESGGVWSVQPQLFASDGQVQDQFGSSVSLSGNTAVIGASGNGGVAYVFGLSGGVWNQQQELAPSDPAENDLFGASVSLSGNTILVGAYGNNNNQGAAYVFALSGGTWSQQQKLIASAAIEFGWSVSLSGNTAVIGAAGSDGVAHVFVPSGGVWTEQQELADSDATTNEHFGNAVSLSGSTIVIGAYDKTVNSQAFNGAAYVFAEATGSTGTEPTITGVGVSGGGADIAQNAWISIYGSNLAPASVGTGLTWSSAPSFASGQMPTALGGVSVTVNGKPAYIYFVSAAQINVLTPLDSATGSVAVEVNNGTATSAAYTANLEASSPGFLRFGDGIHIAAEHAGYTLLGPASMSVPGYTFTPATPGETILLFGDGFGLPVSTLTAGSDVQTGALPTPWPQVTIGGTTATVQFAGLISPGLYQINVVVPSNAANGDNQVIATYGGASSPTGAMIPVAQ
jgi:uncharacterized protein (TIGR03437 family)